MLKRVNDIFPNWVTSGIFAVLENYSVPWKGAVDSQSLDVAYHGQRSGDKLVSTLVGKLLQDDALSVDNAKLIAMAMVATYGTNWSKMWDTLSFQYNPIENYSMTETEDTTSTDTGTVATDNNTESSSNQTNANSVYGFNSAEGVGSDTQTGSGKTTVAGTETEMRNLGSTAKRELKRSGNIGVTTSQQMIESERQLWEWYFYDIVFADIDKMLTLQIY